MFVCFCCGVFSLEFYYLKFLGRAVTSFARAS